MTNFLQKYPTFEERDLRIAQEFRKNEEKINGTLKNTHTMNRKRTSAKHEPEPFEATMADEIPRKKKYRTDLSRIKRRWYKRYFKF